MITSTPETDAVVRNAATSDHPPTRLAATLTVKCEKLERERDEAKEVAKEADAGHDMALADLAKCEAATAIIISKAKDLINRWDQPSWKDSTPTAQFIYALKNAVEHYEKN